MLEIYLNMPLKHDRNSLSQIYVLSKILFNFYGTTAPFFFFVAILLDKIPFKTLQILHMHQISV